MPPASPPPSGSNGDVCADSIATRLTMCPSLQATESRMQRWPGEQSDRGRHRCRQRDRCGNRPRLGRRGIPRLLCSTTRRPDPSRGRRDRRDGGGVRRDVSRRRRAAGRGRRATRRRPDQQRRRRTRRRPRRRRRSGSVADDVRDQRHRDDADHQSAGAGVGCVGRGHHREHRLDRRPPRLRGRRRLHGGEARTRRRHRDAAAGAQRPAGPGDRDRAGDGEDRRVLARPPGRRPGQGRRGLRRRGSAAVSRGRRRGGAVGGHPSPARRHRPHGHQASRAGGPPQDQSSGRSLAQPAGPAEGRSSGR